MAVSIDAAVASPFRLSSAAAMILPSHHASTAFVVSSALLSYYCMSRVISRITGILSVGLRWPSAMRMPSARLPSVSRVSLLKIALSEIMRGFLPLWLMAVTACTAMFGVTMTAMQSLPASSRRAMAGARSGAFSGTATDVDTLPPAAFTDWVTPSAMTSAPSRYKVPTFLHLAATAPVPTFAAALPADDMPKALGALLSVRPMTGITAWLRIAWSWPSEPYVDTTTSAPSETALREHSLAEFCSPLESHDEILTFL